jgi:CO dehydrogenase maturation factor
VLAVDADSDANLAAALGMPRDRRASIVPIAEHRALIEERTGARVGQYGQMFKLNPEVSDIPDEYAYEHRGVRLLVLGAIEAGGSGCACPENVLIKALVTDLVLRSGDVLILDCEAGLEHLGRGTAHGVDALVAVVEPGQRACDCALRVVEMAEDIGIRRVFAVANKIATESDEAFVRKALPSIDLVACIPHSEAIRLADRDGVAVLDAAERAVRSCFEVIATEVMERDGHHA